MKRLLISSIIAAASLGFAAAGFAQPDGQRRGQGHCDGQGRGPRTSACLRASSMGQPADCLLDLQNLPKIEMTAAMKQALLNQWEEEKFARDVYSNFASLYELPLFSRIASSESRHMTHVNDLLLRYDLAAPTNSQEAGVYSNEILNKLYFNIVTQGQTGLKEALLEGARIEESDIANLEKMLSELGPAKSDVKAVFEALLQASERHLKAFQKQGGRF